jgi:hypothetical protein
MKVYVGVVKRVRRRSPKTARYLPGGRGLERSIVVSNLRVTIGLVEKTPQHARDKLASSAQALIAISTPMDQTYDNKPDKRNYKRECDIEPNE